jgi:hypothetical protein
LATAIIQYDDRSPEKLQDFRWLIDRNARYAQSHGYDHDFVSCVDNMKLPPFWMKPFIVRDLLTSSYDTVLWLDTDAVIHDMNRSIDSLFDNTAAMVFSPDLPVWNAPFNAGVFACKKTALPILDDWCALFRREIWEDENGEPEFQGGEYAGRDFEQGAFSHDILPKYRDSGLLLCLPWTRLQSPIPTEDSFTLHFMANYRFNIPIYQASRMDLEGKFQQ